MLAVLSQLHGCRKLNLERKCVSWTCQWLTNTIIAQSFAKNVTTCKININSGSNNSPRFQIALFNLYCAGNDTRFSETSYFIS